MGRGGGGGTCGRAARFSRGVVGVVELDVRSPRGSSPPICDMTPTVTDNDQAAALELEEPETIIDEEDVEDLNEAREVIPYNFEITSYGADYDVEGLVKRLERKDILVPTFDPEVPETESGIVGFQRKFVWRRPQSDRFIESLLLGLPVPGIFLVREPSGVLLVLDGQQRLRTLAGFFRGVIGGHEFKLESVQDRFKGLTYETLLEEDKRRLNDAIIHATVVRQDVPTDDQESVYLIFERLNTGGTNLQPQEIRAALYNGVLGHLIRALNENADWRAVYGKPSERLKDHELILRFFALLFHGGQYQRPMKVFLNRYMATNRDLSLQPEATLRPIFEDTIRVLRRAKGDRLFRIAKTLNAAVFDAVMTGVAGRLLTSGPIADENALASRYDALLRDEDFREAVSKATADEESVRVRLTKAREAFAGL
jgi:hypothetical protein